MAESSHGRVIRVIKRLAFDRPLEDAAPINRVMGPSDWKDWYLVEPVLVTQGL